MRSIQLKDDYSTYRVVSSDAGAKHGFNTHAYVLDELHCLPNGELLEALETSTGARRQPLGILITTADYERPGSVCNAKHDYACKVRDGIIDDPAFLPVIYEASRDDDWKSRETWVKANPNIGVSISEEYLEAACKRAQDDPGFENSFKRLHLNIRTEQDVRIIPADKWNACAGSKTLRLDDFRGRDCWAGLDMAQTSDMTAMGLVFREPDDVFALLPIFWMPQETAREREKRDRMPYTQWIADGWIRGTLGATTDYATIRRDINQLVDVYGIKLREIAIDRLFQGDQLGQELEKQDGLTVLAFGQGFLSMAAPTKRFVELISGCKIVHGGNPVLKWMASNAAVEMDAAGNMKFSKAKSTQRIDGIVACTMGLARALASVEQDGPSAGWTPMVLDGRL